MPFDFSISRQTPQRDWADRGDRGDCLPLELRDVVLRRGGRALVDRLSLSLEAGSRTVLMGPNGAGKSLTLRLLQGVLTPDEGEVRASGCRLHEARRRIGLVLQRPVVLRRTVRANLEHALRVLGCPRAQRRARIESLLALSGLERCADAPARGLSGGEQQCLSIVRALAAEPSVLLLDEPTASLDPHATQSVEKLIAKTAQAGVKIVLVTHDAGQARRFADEVLFLHRGRLTERTPAAQFFAAPASAEARAYLAGQLVL